MELQILELHSRLYRLENPVHPAPATTGIRKMRRASLPENMRWKWTISAACQSLRRAMPTLNVSISCIADC